jgi:hypothetical protein
MSSIVVADGYIGHASLLENHLIRFSVQNAKAASNVVKSDGAERILTSA